MVLFKVSKFKIPIGDLLDCGGHLNTLNSQFRSRNQVCDLVQYPGGISHQKMGTLCHKLTQYSGRL